LTIDKPRPNKGKAVISDMNRPTTSSIVQAWSIVSLVSLLCSVGLSAMAAEKRVTIAYPGLSAELFPVIVADKKGFFQRVGLRPALTLMPSGVTTAALSLKELDYTTNGSALLTGALQGLAVRVVMGIANHNLFTLVVAADIKTPKDLKDKTIGVNAFGGTQALSTESYLRKIGLEPGRDVRFLVFGTATARLAALEKNLIQATLLPPPANVLAERKGYRILVQGDEMVKMPLGLFGTHVEKIRTDRDEVASVITAVLSGIDFIHNQPKEAVQLLAQWAKLEPAAAQRVYELVVDGYPLDGRLIDDEILTLAELIQKAGNLKTTKPLSISDLVDPVPLKETLGRLGRR
jgi:ABC-type nitrate/sulfonate/bicarbonate transport system substrate-binding protein